MGLTPGFWNGQRVFVTGHTGFKGSWLSLWLAELGAEVTGFAPGAPTQPSLFEAARVGEVLRSIEGDVRDREAVGSALDDSGAEIVIHMAAQPLVRKSFRDPVQTYDVNVMGTVNVLDAVRQSATARVVLNVTTDKCYEDRGWARGYREDDALGGSDPYSSSKGCSELVTAAYRRSFFEDPDSPRVASARAGNVIGGGDWAQDRLVPDAMRAALAGEPLRVRNPEAIRPWQHVLNPLAGYLLLVERVWDDPAFAQGWNFGPEAADARPVGWIATRLAQEWGDGELRVEIDQGEHPPESHYLKLDSSRARRLLGWKPPWDLAAALHHVVEWYRGYGSGSNVREVTLGQIRAFTADLGHAVVRR